MLLPSTLSILCLILCSVPAQATEIVFSCDGVLNRTGVGYPEVITLDTDKRTVSHLKQTWSEGQESRLAANLVQFVQITDRRLMWGQRRKNDGINLDLFSIDRSTGAYTWVNSHGTQIAHGECRLPALTS